MQEVVAPFALENLGCTGNESRLLDCPVRDVGGSRSTDYRYYDYATADSCDPASDSYAFVACGVSSAAGVPTPTLRTAQLLPGVALRS